MEVESYFLLLLAEPRVVGHSAQREGVQPTLASPLGSDGSAIMK